MSRSSVKRYAKLAEQGRPLAPKKRPGSRPKMDESARRLLEADLEEHPAATLSQRCEYLGRVAGIWVGESTLSRMLGHANIAITLDTYSHVLPDMQEKAAKALEEALR